MADDNSTPGAQDGDPMADLEGLRKVLGDGNLEQTLKVYHESLRRDFFGTPQDAQRAITMRKVAAMLGKKVKRMDAIRGVQGRHEELILNRTIDFQEDFVLIDGNREQAQEGFYQSLWGGSFGTPQDAQWAIPMRKVATMRKKTKIFHQYCPHPDATTKT
jgi:hypothetical protein